MDIICKVLHRLLCDECQNLLSYFPISQKNDLFVCGRCQKNNAAVRAEFYEALAELHRFNCRYHSKGCQETLFPKNIPKHEDVFCLFRPVHCIVPSCDWQETFNQLQPHCRNQHPQMILEENQNFIIDPEISDNIKMIFLYNNQMFLVSSKFDKTQSTLQLSISPHRELEKKDTLFQLTLRSSKLRLTKLVGLDTESLTDCSNFFGKNISTIDASLATKNFPRNSSETHRKKSSKIILNCPKCTKCSKCLFLPIFSNSEGAVVCESCFLENSTSITENIALSKTIKMLEFYCPNNTYGCDFTGFLYFVKIHQYGCEFQIIECLVPGCQSEMQQKELINHFQEKHEILKNGNIVKCLINFPESESHSQCFIFEFDNKFFAFVLTTFEDNNICFSVEKISKIGDLFDYEIAIMDKSIRGDRLVVRRSCPIFSSFKKNKRTLHTEDKRYCTFHKRQLEYYYQESNDQAMLEFKILITNDCNYKTPSLK